MWDAKVYDRYGKERVQPSLDLTSKIQNKPFQRILDAGCGSGMSTACLVSAFPNAEILGVDLSHEMLQKAKASLPTVPFLQRDCSKPLSDLGTFDLIFSNAFLQWLPNQEEFITHSFAMLRPHMEYLDPQEQALFFEDILHRVKNIYPRQANGKILFPFRRLFLLGEKLG